VRRGRASTVPSCRGSRPCRAGGATIRVARRGRRAGRAERELGSDVDQKLGPNGALVAIDARGGVHEIEVRDAIGGRRGVVCRSVVIGARHGETGVLDQPAGGFVIAVVIERRGREDQVGVEPAQQRCDATATCIIEEDSEVVKAAPGVIGAQQTGGVLGLDAAHAAEFFGAVFGRAAITVGERHDGNRVAARGELGQRATGQDLGVVGVGVNG